MGPSPRAAGEVRQAADTRPILLVPYRWVGDFVRCHTVVRLLKARFPQRPVDLLATPLTAPLADFMPGVRAAIVADLPRSRLALRKQQELARRLRANGYGTALVMPGTWKSALAPFFAGIPERIGWFGEARWGLLNDLRFGERKLPRMIDRCAALAPPKGAELPRSLPPPQMNADAAEIGAWRRQTRGAPVVAICPGAIGPGKQWPAAAYGELARRLTGYGFHCSVLGSAAERPLAAEIAAIGGPNVHDLTGALHEAVAILAAADAVVANDSGLLHIAAALGRPSVGIYARTDPRLWAPLNPVTIVEPAGAAAARTTTRHGLRDLRIEDVGVDQVERAVRAALEAGPASSER